VNGYEHSLQTATRVLRDGGGDEDIVVALLHDVGEAVWGANHGEVIAGMLRPYVSPRSYWVLKHPDLFQGYHYAHHFGLNRGARDTLKDSPHYDACKRFADVYDQAAFDPDYKSEPLEAFVPMVNRVLSTKPYALDPTNPKAVVR
jgi:predicted HD phosphohydrolase